MNMIFTKPGKFLIVLIISIQALFLITNTIAADYTIYKYLQYDQIVNNQFITLSNAVPSDQIITTSDIHKEGFNTVRLFYNRHLHTDINAGVNWILDVHYRISWYDQAGNFISAEEDDLTIDNSDHIEALNKKAVIGFKVKCEVLSVSAKTAIGDALNLQSLPADIMFECGFVSEVFQTIAEREIKLNIAPSAENLLISWTYLPGAEEYQLEYVFIDKNDIKYSQIQSTGLPNPFFYKEPVRVSSSEQFFILSNTYPAGQLFFRIRGVSKMVDGQTSDFTHSNFSYWFYSDEDDAIATVIFDNNNLTPLEEERNWELSKTYAEGGKYKEIVKYYDENLFMRQAITNLSTEKNIAVAETKYDYEGRPTVQILPAPIRSNSLSYKAFFNTTGGQTNVFDKEDFDVLNSTSNFPPLDNTSGASRYYSDQNNLGGINRDFIPDADGYVYSLMRYKRDNTNKPQIASGVGQAFKMGGGRETKYFYDNPTITELQRLFGENVGEPTFYKRVYTVDPNQQISVAYLNHAEQTIATALVGSCPSNLTALPDVIAVDIVADLCPPNNDPNHIDYNKILDKTFTNVITPTTYEFKYDVSPIIANLCATCAYDLEISIHNPDGLSLLNDPNSTNDRIDFDHEALPSFCACDPLTGNITCHLSVANCSTAINEKLIHFDAYFTQQGEYHLFKELKLVPKIFDPSTVTSVNVNGQNYTQPELLASYQSNVNIQPCLPECDCGNPQDEGYYDCWINCMSQMGLYDFASNVASHECNSLLVKMEKQVKPFKVVVSDATVFDEDYPGYYFGQEDLPGLLYYDFDKNGSVDVSFTNFLSTSSLSTSDDIAQSKVGSYYYVTKSIPSLTIQFFEGFWDRVKERYDNASFVSSPFASVTIGSQAYTFGNISDWYATISAKANSTNPQDVEDLQAAWKEEWTRSLVVCHPEYIHYEACVAYEDSRKYDFLLADIADWDHAMAKGALDPLKNEANNTINYGTSPETSVGSIAGFDYTQSPYLPFPNSETALNTSFNDPEILSATDLKYAIDPFVYNINSNSPNSFIGSFDGSGFVPSNSTELSNPLGVLTDLVQNCQKVFPSSGNVFSCTDIVIDPETIWEIVNENRFSLNTHGGVTGCSSSVNDKFYHFTQYVSPVNECPPTNTSVLIADVPANYPIEEKRWQIFKGLYLEQKRKAVKRIVLDALPDNNDSHSPSEAYPDGYLDVDGYVRLDKDFLPWAVFTTPYESTFPDLSEGVGDGSSAIGNATSLATQQITQECEEMSENYSEIWASKVEALRVSELDPNPNISCFSATNLSEQQLRDEKATLKGEFYSMAFAGCTAYYESVFNIANAETCPHPTNIPESFEPYQPVVTNTFLTNNTIIQGICSLSCLRNCSANCFDRVGSWMANIVNACPSLTQAQLDELQPLLETVCAENSNLFTVADISQLTEDDPGFVELLNFLTDVNHPCSISQSQIASYDGCTQSPTLFTGSLVRFLNEHVFNNGINLTGTSPAITFPTLLFNDDFEAGVSSGWYSSAGVALDNSCGFLCSNSLYFNNPGTPPTENYISTDNLNVTGGGTISFDLKVPDNIEKEGLHESCDQPTKDSKLLLQYKLSTSSSWETIATYSQEDFHVFAHVSIAIPSSARSGATKFRWMQEVSSVNEIYDVWILDNVSISSAQTIADQGLLASLYANSLTVSFVNIDGKITISGTGKSTSGVCSPSLLCSPILYIREATNPSPNIPLSSIVSIDNYYVDFLGRVMLDMVVNNGAGNHNLKGWLFAENPCSKLADCVTSSSVQSEGCISVLFNQASVAGHDAWDNAVAAQAAAEALAYNNNCTQGLQEDFQASFPIKEYHYTLYYYDQAGNLVQTVPPAGFKPWPTDLDDHVLKTTYQYNSQNQVVRQITPDGGETKFLYDDARRLRVSENEKQRNSHSYSYTKYDALGRVKEVAELRNQTSFDLSNLTQQQINNRAFPDYYGAGVLGLSALTRTYYETPYNLSLIGSKQNNLRNRISYLEYYDGITYNQNGINFLNSTNKSAIAYNYDEVGNVKNLWNLVDLNRVKEIEYDYDLISGKVNKVSYEPGNTDQFIHKYYYDADNRLTNVYTSHDGLLWDEDAEYFYYPHGPVAREELGQDKIQGRDYIYTLQGWLKGINLPNYDNSNILEPGKDGDISSTQLNRYIPKDEFGSILGYYENDYYSIVNHEQPGYDGLMSSSLLNNSSYPGKPLYNGNIGMIANSVAPGLDGKDVAFLTEAGASGMLNFYRYDQLNRILEYKPYKSVFSSGVVSIAARGSGDNSFDESYAYDANGNITSLTRFGTSTAGPMHSFTYKYATEHTINGSATLDRPLNNKLWDVVNSGLAVDGFPTSGPVGGYTQDAPHSGLPVYDPHHLKITNGNYDYDEIGNLIKDATGEIENIEWNPAGKMTKINRTSGSTKDALEFCYDAMGNRVIKIVKPYNAADESQYNYTYYYRDAQGNVMNTEEVSFATTTILGDIVSSTKTDLEWPIYGTSRIGLARKTAFYSFQPQPAINYHGAYTRVLGNKDYELTNHLGNVMVTVNDKKFGYDNGNGQANYYTADITSAQDYYPFGSLMPGRSYSTPSYRYGLNGKEKDDEVKGSGNAIEFGGRSIYDSRLARFVSVDPRWREFPFMSSYCYSANSPIRFIDDDGEGAGDIVGGFVIGVVTTVTPFPISYALRSLGGRIASDKGDYNHSLQSTDIGMMAFGSNLTKGGTGAMAVGTTAVIAGGGVSVTGAGAIVGAPVAIGGATLAGAGAISTGAGLGIMTTSTLNSALGYNYGNQVNASSTPNSSSNTGKPAVSNNPPSGKWVNESTSGWSQSAKDYQEYVSGSKAGSAFEVGGVRFDGIRGNTLLEAKSSFNNFVNKKTGEFYSWFKGANGLVEQARRQIGAAGGAPIEWNFSTQKALDATKKLFKDRGVEGITLKYNPKQ